MAPNRHQFVCSILAFTISCILCIPIHQLKANSEKYATQDLFDGTSMAGWKPSDFDGGGEVRLDSGTIRIVRGKTTSGVRWTKDFPKINYEVQLEAMRVEGSDFFCGMTFPVADTFCTLIVGGWGGFLVGLSSIDGLDASENFTGSTKSFQNKRWYNIRLRVTSETIQAWIDNQLYVDADIGNSDLSIRWEMKPSRPFGIATWKTTAALRNIRVIKLKESNPPPK